MAANTVKSADGRFLHGILILLIVAALGSGAVAAVSIAKSQPGSATLVSQP